MNLRTKTYADILRPVARPAVWAYDASLVIGASLVVALSAQLAIRLAAL